MRFFLLFISIAAFAQESTRFLPKRLADGYPDFWGVWRNASVVAAFNVEGQAASYNGPAGALVIADLPDGKLPYLPEARVKAVENAAHRERDQDHDYLVVLPEAEHSVRMIALDGRPHLKNYWSWREIREAGGRVTR